MFKRIIHENWAEIVPIISFWLTFIIFLAIVVRAIFMKRKEVDRMGHMPLESEETETKQPFKQDAQ